jgi:hypothetical protein
VAEQIAHERLFLKRDGFLKRKMLLHKAVYAASALSDVLFDALFKTQNRGGCLVVIHEGTLSTTPHYTVLWLRLKKIPVCDAALC